jgi:hypothetical protein
MDKQHFNVYPIVSRFLNTLKVDKQPLVSKSLFATEDVSTINGVLEKGYDVTEKYNKPLRDALLNENLNVAMLLLSKSEANPGDCDNNAIIMACCKGQFDVVVMLLADERVDPSARNNDSLCCACERGHIDIVQLLLKDPRVQPTEEALQLALDNGHTNIAMLLVETGKVMFIGHAAL